MKPRRKLFRSLSELPKAKFYIVGFRNAGTKKSKSAEECENVIEARKKLNNKENKSNYFIIKKI